MQARMKKEDTTMITVQVKRDLHRDLVAFARASDLTISQVMRRAIRDILNHTASSAREGESPR